MKNNFPHFTFYMLMNSRKSIWAALLQLIQNNYKVSIYQALLYPFTIELRVACMNVQKQKTIKYCHLLTIFFLKCSISEQKWQQRTDTICPFHSFSNTISNIKNDLENYDYFMTLYFSFNSWYWPSFWEIEMKTGVSLERWVERLLHDVSVNPNSPFEFYCCNIP